MDNRRGDNLEVDDREEDEEEEMENDERTAVSLDGAHEDPQRFDEIRDSPLGHLQVDTGKEEPETARVEGDERDEDFITVGVDPELMTDTMEEYTQDAEVLDDFAERQAVASGSEALLDELRQHNSKSPDISSGDLDADWQRADQVGEEAAGGSVATPDQDVVEELGEALGIIYKDGEPLATEDKLLERDANRWELNPESADDDDQELAELEDLHDRLDDLDALGLVDAEDLAGLDPVQLEEIIDEIDDGLLTDDSEEEDDLTALDDDWLLGGIDEED